MAVSPDDRLEPTAATVSATDQDSKVAHPRLQSWGPFKLIEEIGAGSFGEVYRAFDTTLEREVAVKLLHSRGLDLESEHGALLREARAMAQVRHNNVVTVYGVARHEGRVGFWSDFVRGKTLTALLESHGPFGPEESARIGIDLGRALSSVHAAGLLHRDIKARNAMREEGGRILLMDFGLTHRTGDDRGIAGTPAYMAPELFAGHHATVSSDLYALGVLLFHLMTGRYPVDGSDVGLQAAHDSGTRNVLLDLRPDIPQSLARVVEIAINPDSSKRFASAGQMIAAISEAVGGSASSGDTRAMTAAPARRLGRWMLALVAALLLTLLVPQVRRAVFPAGTPDGQPTPMREEYLKAHDFIVGRFRPKGIEAAIPLLKGVVEKDPKYAPAWADLGRANFLLFRQLRDASYVEPTRDASLQALALNPALASAHVTLGMLYTEMGENDLAAHELSEALRLDNRNADAHAAMAELNYRQGRTQDAEIEFRKSIDLDPASWRNLNEFGFFYLRVGKHELAADQYQRAAALTPDTPTVLNNLGIAYWRLNRLTEAREVLTRAIELQPSANRYVNLARVQSQQGQHADAAANYQKAVVLNPESYFAWGEMAAAYRRTPGEATQAAAAYTRAISLAEKQRQARPKDSSLLADLGTYYAVRHDEARSLPLLRQAAALAADDASVLQQAAAGFELLHHRDDALKWLQQAVMRGRPLSAIEGDEDLAALRADSRYQAIVQSARQTK